MFRINILALILSCFALLFGEQDDSYCKHFAEDTSRLPVDISFLVVDLKVGEEHGIKICEVQQAALSLFKGYDYIYHGNGLIGKNFCQFLSQFHNTFWYVSCDLNYAPLKEQLLRYGWQRIPVRRHLFQNQEFQEKASLPVDDATRIDAYHGIVYARSYMMGGEENFRQKYPGVILIDAANAAYWHDKYKMSTLFLNHEVLQNFKPKWGLYPKKYYKNLAKEIQRDIGGDYFVIKPRRGAEGRGVIIVEKRYLDVTLRYIFSKSAELMKDKDEAYNFWAIDQYDSFIVEEFILSDPIVVPEFDFKCFNCTMRVTFALVYQQQTIQLHYMGEYWIIPNKSIDEPGSLNEKNKASMIHPHICEVAPEFRERIKRELSEPLILLYQRMLGIEELIR